MSETNSDLEKIEQINKKANLRFEKEQEKQKHEKIEKMAWEYFLYHADKSNPCRIAKITESFNAATDFYDYAKEKQEKASDDKSS